MKIFLAFVFLALFTPVVLSYNGAIQFFPAWSNCVKMSDIQFMDFYLDHTPDVLTEKKDVPTMNANLV